VTAIFITAIFFLGAVVFGIKLAKVGCYPKANSPQIDTIQPRTGLEGHAQRAPTFTDH
jgi:hypothetical protein